MPTPIDLDQLTKDLDALRREIVSATSDPLSKEAAELLHDRVRDFHFAHDDRFPPKLRTLLPSANIMLWNACLSNLRRPVTQWPASEVDALLSHVHRMLDFASDLLMFEWDGVAFVPRHGEDWRGSAETSRIVTVEIETSDGKPIGGERLGRIAGMLGKAGFRVRTVAPGHHIVAGSRLRRLAVDIKDTVELLTADPGTRE